MVDAWRDEIDRDIDNVKRTNLDRWMRREWHRAGSRDNWSEGRKAKWMEWVGWRSRRCDGGAGHSYQVPAPRLWPWPLLCAGRRGEFEPAPTPRRAARQQSESQAGQVGEEGAPEANGLAKAVLGANQAGQVDEEGVAQGCSVRPVDRGKEGEVGWDRGGETRAMLRGGRLGCGEGEGGLHPSCRAEAIPQSALPRSYNQA